MTDGNQAVIKIFSARACAAPLRDAAGIYREREGAPRVEISTCDRHCAEPVAEKATGEFGGHDFLVEIAEAGIHDLAISGAEYLLDDGEVRGIVVPGERRTIASRRSGILVQAGNPKGITGFEDLTCPDLRIGISVIDCLKGAWEDVSGRAGLIEDIRPNISFHANGCVAIVEAVAQGVVDVAIGWSGFDHLAEGRIEVVDIRDEWAITRGTGVGLLSFAGNPDGGREFMDFLVTPEARACYEDWGWVL